MGILVFSQIWESLQVEVWHWPIIFPGQFRYVMMIPGMELGQGERKEAWVEEATHCLEGLVGVCALC